jgi:pimeloyl-ACP methyl ester carboxylesterase
MRTLLTTFVLLATSVPLFAQRAPACAASLAYGTNPAAGHYVAVNGVKIYYEVYGSGPVVVLLHGNGSSIARMTCQIAFFSTNHRVIAMDTRGRGKSDDGPDRFTFEQQADDVAAILAQEHVERADVLGQSDGGIIALVFGIRHPGHVRKIVASAPNLWPESDAIFQWSIDEMKSSVAEADRMIAAGDKSRDWVRRKRQLEQDLYEPHVSLDAVHSIAVPTLLIGADDDVIRPEHYLAIYRSLQHGQFFLMPGATHGTLISENAELFNTVVAKFLDRPFSRPTSQTP